MWGPIHHETWIWCAEGKSKSYNLDFHQWSFYIIELYFNIEYADWKTAELYHLFNLKLDGKNGRSDMELIQIISSTRTGDKKSVEKSLGHVRDGQYFWYFKDYFKKLFYLNTEVARKNCPPLSIRRTYKGVYAFILLWFPIKSLCAVAHLQRLKTNWTVCTNVVKTFCAITTKPFLILDVFPFRHFPF